MRRLSACLGLCALLALWLAYRLGGTEWLSIACTSLGLGGLLATSLSRKR